jgi:hypothetical protein
MNRFILDCETKPQQNLVGLFSEEIKPKANLKDPEKIKADIEAKELASRKEMATDTDYADIICVGIKKIGEEGRTLTLKEMEQWFKDRTIKITIDEIETTRYEFEFITFNGKSFDIPLLIKQGLNNGLDFPYKKLMEMTKKFKDSGHYDLKEILSFGGDWRSLDLYLKIYLGKQKTAIDFNTADDEEIMSYCKDDLSLTEELYNKFKQII